jgi:predicted HicB family RNase H-like nuclease
VTHRGYSAGTIEFDEATGDVHGRVALGREVVTFRGATILEAVRSFCDSVDGYLARCTERGIEPERPGDDSSPHGLG